MQSSPRASVARPVSIASVLRAFAALLFLVLLLVGGLVFLGARYMHSGPVYEPGVADPATARALPAGNIVGYVDDSGGHTWRGIPFAKAPVGELRWRAPRRPVPWSGTLEALALGSACVQSATPMMRSVAASLGDPIGSEDCLFLNIHAPDNANEGAPLPVMVWIHGGSNAFGEGGSWDLADLAVSRNVIIVSLNYRLGILGWFSHPKLWNDNDSALDRSGNFGTLDLVRGLEWVRENIAPFGGDPGNVTLFGSSAGGSNIAALLLAPQSKGLFHRAVAMSGGVWSTPVEALHAWVEDDGADLSSLEVLAALRLASELDADREAAKAAIDALSPEEVASALRAASVAELQEAIPATSWADARASLQDGTVLPKTGFLAAYAAGNFHRVPFITGSCRDEAKFFMMMNPKSIWQYLSDEPSYHRDAEYDSNRWKALAVDEIALAMGRAGHRDVWAYRFDWDDLPDRYGFNLHRFLGAFHGVLGPFLLGPSAPNSDLIDSETNGADVARLREELRSYWTNFAYAGDPGTGRSSKLPAWERWSSEPAQNKLLVFDAPHDGGTRMTPDFGSIETIVRRLETDERFSDEARCEAFETLAWQARISGEPAPELANCPPRSQAD